MKTEQAAPSDWKGHTIALDQLRITHENQLQAFRTLDSKIETMLRLAVFLGTGIAVFLTFSAGRGEPGLHHSRPIFWAILAGAVLHLYSFFVLLAGYGALGRRSDLDVGPNAKSVARRALRFESTGEREIIHGYRASIQANLRTYERRVRELNLASTTLVFTAGAYLIAIYLLAVF